MLVDEHHPAAIRRHVGLAGPRAARQPAHLSAGHVHRPEVGVLREHAVGLGLVEDEHAAAGGPRQRGPAVSLGEDPIGRTVAPHDPDLAEAREDAARVREPLPVGAEAGIHLAHARVRERDGGGETPLPPMLRLLLERREGPPPPIRPQRVEGGAGDLLGRELVQVGDEAAGVDAGHLGEHALAVTVPEVVEERFAEQVGGLPVRPAVETGDRAVLSGKVVLEGGHAQHHQRVRVAAAPERRVLGLLVGREAFDDPGGAGRVGEEEGRPAEHVARRPHEPVGLAEVDDVGQLVAEQHLQPVVVVSELVVAVRRHRAQVHQRVGQRRSEAVGIVVDVGEDDLHPSGPLAVALLVSGEDLGGERGGPARHRLQALVIVHGHAARGHAAEPEVRRECGRPRRRR